jgi:hypothetical protein
MFVLSISRAVATSCWALPRLTGSRLGDQPDRDDRLHRNPQRGLLGRRSSCGTARPRPLDLLAPSQVRSSPRRLLEASLFLRQLASDDVRDGRTDDVALWHHGRVMAAMEQSIVAVLRSAGYTVEPDANDMEPFSVLVQGLAEGPLWRDGLGNQRAEAVVMNPSLRGRACRPFLSFDVFAEAPGYLHVSPISRA